MEAMSLILTAQVAPATTAVRGTAMRLSGSYTEFKALIQKRFAGNSFTGRSRYAEQAQLHESPSSID